MERKVRVLIIFCSLVMIAVTFIPGEITLFSNQHSQGSKTALSSLVLSSSSYMCEWTNRRLDKGTTFAANKGIRFLSSSLAWATSPSVNVHILARMFSVLHYLVVVR